VAPSILEEEDAVLILLLDGLAINLDVKAQKW
jgi:hypothetical protein